MKQIQQKQTKALKPQKHFRSYICTYKYWSGRESKLCMRTFFGSGSRLKKYGQTLELLCYGQTDKLWLPLRRALLLRAPPIEKKVYTHLVCRRTDVKPTGVRTKCQQQHVCPLFLIYWRWTLQSTADHSAHIRFSYSRSFAQHGERQSVNCVSSGGFCFLFSLKHQIRLMICFADRRWSQHFVAVELLFWLVCIKNVLSSFEKCHKRRAQ